VEKFGFELNIPDLQHCVLTYSSKLSCAENLSNTDNLLVPSVPSVVLLPTGADDLITSFITPISEAEHASFYKKIGTGTLRLVKFYR
jgi:hypothetical protein